MTNKGGSRKKEKKKKKTVKRSQKEDGEKITNINYQIIKSSVDRRTGYPDHLKDCKKY